MSTHDQSENVDRPLLILLSDDPQFCKQVRSRQHSVFCWTPGDDPGQHEFSGDPADPSAYEWTKPARGVTVVIDIAPVERARAALRAVRGVRPDAAALLLATDARDVDHDEDGTLVRSGELRDVLRLDVDEELQRLEAERRRYCLRQFAASVDVVPILIHGNPDPDAVSSALAVRAIINGSSARTPIVTLEDVLRPENRRMVELLHIPIARVTEAELLHFERVIVVDMQPVGLQHDSQPRFAVIDHHPPEAGYTAEFKDIRPEYGATATILTEYLRSVSPRRVSSALATALVFGIKTDTASLTRGVSPADVAAYAFLQQSADARLVRRFERASYSAPTMHAFGRALADAIYEDGLCSAFMGKLVPEEGYVLTELADLCLTVDNVTWVVAAAEVGDELVLALRHAGGPGPGAGEVARALAGADGSGGGHATMARVTMPVHSGRRQLIQNKEEPASALHAVVLRTIEEMTRRSNRRGLHPTHQE